MEDKPRLEMAIENLRQYAEAKWNLFLLNTSDKASSMISTIVSLIIVGLIMVFVLLFLSVSAALWIGHSVGNASMGFLYVGLFYLLAGIIIYSVRESLIRMPIIKKLLIAFHATDED